jgi:DNA-binding MarR family transcriptional regulator
MKIHQGIRPHDIVILLKMITIQKENWYLKDLASELKISQSEISESLNRSQIAGFVGRNKKIVDRESLLEFLAHGLKYTFPEEPGKIITGFSAAQSAAPLYHVFRSQESFVWPHKNGNRRGHYIRPLHKNAPEASMKDDRLYELLALSDVIRTGSRSDKERAVQELRRKIL